MTLDEVRTAWRNAYYRATLMYICVLVTIIFFFQLFQYFVLAPEASCQTPSAASLIPVIGVLFDEKSF